ncbi:hypothetical protein [Halogranum rubrum]|nr:hypothetical protein [Halogranum salarium]
MTSHQSLVEELQRLDKEDPLVHTLLSRHHQEIKTAFDTTSRSYPTSRQLYGVLEEPEIHPAMLARVLGYLATIDIIDWYTVRDGANRYDLREYDAARFKRVVNLIAE